MGVEGEFEGAGAVLKVFADEYAGVQVHYSGSQERAFGCSDGVWEECMGAQVHDVEDADFAQEPGEFEAAGRRASVGLQLWRLQL